MGEGRCTGVGFVFFFSGMADKAKGSQPWEQSEGINHVLKQ